MLAQQVKRALESQLPSEQVLTGPAQLAAYQYDAGLEPGIPDAVILVEDADQLQRTARWASEYGLILTARGAGTGYTGGAVASGGGVVVSFVRMNQILEVDADCRMAVVQPGVINANLARHLQPFGLFYPPDPASLSVCTLGGNIAENAGGPHCLKYGVTSNYVLGLQLVLADGRLVQVGSRALDPPEYDFTGLLTGSEGTLAFITRATLRLRRPAAGVLALTASFGSVAQAGEAVSALIAAGLLPATIELMDSGMISIVEDYLHAGLPVNAGAMLIIDVEGYPESLEAQLDEITAILLHSHPIEIKQAHTQEDRERIWLARRSAGGAVARISPNEYLVDVSVPRSQLAQALLDIQAIGHRYGYRVCFLAHAGDGNLHPNLLCDFSIAGERERVLQAAGEILKLCAGLGGSIGGEHGIGYEKRDYIPEMYSPAEIGAMLDVKELFDPQGLMNPGKIFPDRIKYQPGLPVQPSDAPAGGIFVPGSAQEAADALAGFQAAGTPVYLSGAGTHWRGEHPAGTLISSSSLSGVIRLSPDDLYITAGSGTSVADLRGCAEEAGFKLPVAAARGGSTIGGALAANANLPLRSLYGGLRDQVLAVQAALADGRLVRFGRPLVKDIAGYQMSKLFTGAYGTLGMVTEVTLKLHPMPRRELSLLVRAPDLQTAVSWGITAWRVSTLGSGTVAVPGSVNGSQEAGYTLVCTIEGHPADVQAEARLVSSALQAHGAGRIEETDQTSASQLWEGVFASPGFVFRTGLPACELSGFLDRLEIPVLSGPHMVDIANGMVLASTDSTGAGETLARLRSAAGDEGYSILESGPRSFLQSSNAWGARRQADDLMRGLKRLWDPANILNRGEFIP